MGGAGVPGRLLLRALLVLLGLRTLLPARSARPEAVVVVPRRVTPRGRAGEADVPGALSYVLPVDGQSRLLHLRPKKLLLAPRLPVFTYTDRGALTVDQPFVPDDCYYHGFVEGTPESLVALSTCTGGLRGMLQLGPLVYEIEPLPASAGFEHALSRTGAGEAGPETPGLWCGVTEEEIRRQASEMQGKAAPEPTESPDDDRRWTHSRFLELAVVVDNTRFVLSGKNQSRVLRQVLDVLNLVDTLYRLLDVRVYLVGLEIWTDGNRVDVTRSIGKVLADFNAWQRGHLLPRFSYDSAHLIVNQQYGITLGLAYVKTICNNHYASAVLSFFDYHLLKFAVVFAHEQGHIFGMTHDTAGCVCKRDKCIMSEFTADTDVFSNCSYREFFDATSRQGKCLTNVPGPAALVTVERCGNRVLEGGEECDCGTVGECREDPCCQSNCRLRPGATCSVGGCCERCRTLPAGQLCRPQAGDCDLPEYCDGVSARCPGDVYMLDGTPCQEDALCFDNVCHGHNRQCRSVFGPGARSASAGCFRTVNMEGDRFGNCGMGRDGYLKCAEDHVLCGRLQCENVREIPRLEEHTTVLQTLFNGTVCWGTDYHFGMNVVDVGHVRDGTMCGPRKMCLARKCVDISALRHDCNPATCHGRGVCNNHQHCHCMYGWEPPLCDVHGFGGSVDSGPAPAKLQNHLYILLIVLGICFLLLVSVILLCMKFGPRFVPGVIQRSRRKKRDPQAEPSQDKTVPSQASFEEEGGPSRP
ncbi:disintegrin and metalloproteinase domain-containing protein 20-like [Tachyglossus aculeatus]|uniref:disintegrin and metalloproteinase domain-containing protein 20-like n=1 Tax=Tachyglossus aculeatus TaxID=9261 RepID=UPI0018F536B7|nr:disintegrin and metalloproteinase domain-containing protein 20-like [Tachyglossus aculeatus]